MNMNEIEGGKADKLSIKDIAKKFGVDVSDIKKQLEMGLEVESEHTDDENQAKEIAMDHLSEMPDYYSRLEKMEKNGLNKANTLEKKIVKKSGDKKQVTENTSIIKRLLHKSLNKFTY